ncbi:MAG: electron transfer flavoprotein subunit beta/FixA family protein [Planctomycetes bacterium]|nr:electron transfer flavoprotein subunit beta/FixA family protein [Planctomycetota bacterium]
MRIIACIKRVPTTDLQPRVAADGKSLDTAGVQYMASFYDEIAVEEALKQKEKHGGEVTVLTIGPAEATKEVREALAKGADKGVILVDAAWAGRDPLATAKALAEKIKALGPDLVLLGRVATDRDNASVGPMLATLLGWACVTDIVGLELDGTKGSARREADGGLETFSFALPAVLTCQKDLNEPRYAGLKGIMAAKKKPVEESPAPASSSQVEIVKLALPPTRKAGRIVGEGAAAVPALIDALRTEAKIL